jgi:hypothetical protein
VYRIPFEAQEGQMLNVTADAAPGAKVDPLIVVLDSQGAALAGDGEYDRANAAIRDYRLPASGTYTLLVSHAPGRWIGSIQVTLTVV